MTQCSRCPAALEDGSSKLVPPGHQPSGGGGAAGQGREGWLLSGAGQRVGLGGVRPLPPVSHLPGFCSQLLSLVPRWGPSVPLPAAGCGLQAQQSRQCPSGWHCQNLAEKPLQGCRRGERGASSLAQRFLSDPQARPVENPVSLRAGRSPGQQPCPAPGLLKGEPKIRGTPSHFGLPAIPAPCVGAGEADSHRPASAKTNIPCPSNPQRGRIRTAALAVNISAAGTWGLHPLPPTGPFAVLHAWDRACSPESAAAGAACTPPCCLHPSCGRATRLQQGARGAASQRVWQDATPFPTAGLARCAG